MALVGWYYSEKITIDYTKIDKDLTDFPVLVKLDSSNFDFSKAQSNGKDIRFALEDGTLLSYERERHDNVNQKAEYWVKIPSVSSSADTTFYIYYGNPNASDGADPTNVWDSNFKLVTHMNNNPDSSHIKDSTINANNGTKYAAKQPTEVDGQIAKAQSFDGTDDYIDCGNNASLDITSAITIEIWEKGYGGGGHYPRIIGKELYSTTHENEAYYIYRIGDSGSHTEGNIITSDHNAHAFDWGQNESGNIWYHLVATYNGSEIKTYKNGEFINSYSVTGNINSVTKPVLIGTDGNLAGFFNGTIDEIRISNIARSAAYIKANDYNLRLNTLLSYGAEVYHVSKLSGTVCDKNGNPITGVVVDIAFLEKGTKELLHTCQSNSNDGTWVDDQIPADPNAKVLAVFSLEGNYNGDTDIAGAEFTTTEQT